MAGQSGIVTGKTGIVYYVSYKTIVGFNSGGTVLRTDRFFSATTSKHITQMGIKAFPTVQHNQFQTLLDKILIASGDDYRDIVNNIKLTTNNLTYYKGE